MKSEKSIGVVIAITILLLATTLSSFSPVSNAQVEQEIDGAAEQEATDIEGSTEREVVEAAEQDEAAEQEATNATDTEREVVEAAEQDEAAEQEATDIE